MAKDNKYVHVKTVTSEVEVKEQFIRTLRERKEVVQNALYLDRGAELFYSTFTGTRTTQNSELSKDHYPFFKEHAFVKDKRIAFISMGCGNASPEAPLLKSATDDGYTVSYFGIDSSLAALELAREELAPIDIEKQFLCADFGSPSFKEEIQELTRDYDVRIFTFFGATVCNLETAYLADIMADVMQKGDYLWAEVSIRPGKTSADDRKLYERFRDYLFTMDAWKNFLFQPLANLDIPEEKGDFFVEMSLKDDLEALRFTFKFNFKEKAVVTYRNQRITFLPGNEIGLFDIIVFDVEGFVRFFEARDFKLLGKGIGGRRGQFMFQYRGNGLKRK